MNEDLNTSAREITSSNRNVVHDHGREPNFVLDHTATAESAHAILVRQLLKRHGSSIAIDNLSLTLSSGVAYGLLGANGSGKSTLLRLLATLEQPSSGYIAILGKDIASAPRHARRAIGFVQDDCAIFRGLTVAEHIDFSARCYGLGRRERLSAVDTMLHLVELDAWRHRPAHSLSRGQRQRLSLATAMVHDPSVLLLDEPLTGLDRPGRDEMLEVLKELRTMGKTMVLASHSFEDVVLVCDSIGILRAGRLVASGPAADFMRSNASSERIVSLHVVAGLEIARMIILQLPQARNLTVQGGHINFAFSGEAPDLLTRLVDAGVSVGEFTASSPAPSDALLQAFRELAL